MSKNSSVAVEAAAEEAVVSAPAKESAPASAEPAGTPAPAEITVEEFCRRVSEKVRRPELINAFFATEKAAGSVKSTEAAFRARFDAFVNKPL